MHRMRIGTRLALAFGVLLGLSVALGGYAILQLGAVRQASSEITHKWMEGVRITSQMNTDASNFRIAEVKHILATEADDKTRFATELKATAFALQANADQYQALIVSTDERKIFDDFRRERQRYLDEHQRLLRMSTAGETEDARALLTYNSQKKYEGASQALRRLVDFNIAGGKAAGALAQATQETARRSIVMALLLSLALGASLSLVIARSIGKPLRQAVEVAGAVAQGDLTADIEARGSDETAMLLFALRAMTASLSQLVVDVHQSSGQVAHGAKEIAMGNFDLSQRTEAQAAKLQQVAATMRQLESAVHAIDGSVHDAARVASGTNELARRGSEVMQRMVDTMHRVSASSERISEITGLIDSIAFKTNILALNAAVEAARAGDAGRGFGVVASEVRALAHSSAQAARDIKGLIEQSRETVEAGNSLAAQAGVAIGEISAHVQQVNSLVAGIGNATNTQSAGISQVCNAIVELDQATQQNAALVEQSAAASESLTGQAKHLVEAVTVFRVAER
jgi:methyl-accepting chemotaxis protein